MSDVKRYWHKPKIGFAVLDPQYYEDESGYVAYEDYAALEAELAKLKGEYEWVASINTALDESNQSAWDELARLRAGQEPVAYQCREIGEGDWADCDKKWFDYCERSPLHDTRTLYTAPQPSAVVTNMTVPDGLKLVPVEPTAGMLDVAVSRPHG